MHKLTDNDLMGYILDSVTQDKSILNCIDGFDNKLNIEINNLKIRLENLVEASESKDNIVYLVKNNDSKFNYVDKDKNTYEYSIINDKPILISKTYIIYEIVEYCDVSSIRTRDKYSGKSWYIESYVDKVCKVKRVN